MNGVAVAPSRNYVRGCAAASLVLATAALLVYRATLLPGLDFGDTAAFQDAGGAREVTPRQGYPLYFALGNLVVWTVGGEPAYGMNLASALWGALACGVLAWVTAVLTRSVAAGAFSGALLAVSYTFWSQAVIAEVYTLHVLLMGLCIGALLWWHRRPRSMRRLAVVFGAYALGFGNHLMMVLLAPTVALFLLLHAPEGARGLLRTRVILLAGAMAALGALQYAWNLSSLWTNPVPPESVAEGLRTFWFDVTKTDWRETMVLGVHESALRPRLAMYGFDVRQQFGIVGILLAAIGALWLAATAWRTLAALAAGWLISVAFAYTYNVGDAHVFFIPSHVFVALAAGGGAAVLIGASGRFGPLAATLLLAFPAWRAADTWPAVDRSGDDRPLRLVRQLTAGLEPERALLVADLNWQLQNGLDYYAHHVRPELLVLRGADRALTLPWLIAANLDAGRDIVLTPASARLLARAYGDLFTIEPDTPVPVLAERLDALEPGAPYVLALLRAYPDVPLDTEELAGAVRRLTGGTTLVPADGVYTVMAGLAGKRPVLLRAERRPFRTSLELGDLRVEVRMESWLPPDTMRRAGFGHVIVNRRHVLTVERGVSVVGLDEGGRVRLTEYASSLFAPLPRLRIRARPGA